MQSLDCYIWNHHLEVKTLFSKRIFWKTVHKILSQSSIKFNKVHYYLKRTDPNFECKMHTVIQVYKEAEIWYKLRDDSTFLISYDEKPCIHAIRRTSPEVYPKMVLHFTSFRNAHYQRWRIASILNEIGLLTGQNHTILSWCLFPTSHHGSWSNLH